MDAEPMILSRQENGVLTLTLNRPQQLNSFNQAMHGQLTDALKLAHQDDSIRCVVLTGAGRAFCAGQDLNERHVRADREVPDLGISLEQRYNPLVRQLISLPKPVICAVNGVSAGAGAALALACDLVIAARSARFIFSFSHLGLVPDCGASWFLPRMVGHARAMGIVLLGEPLTAEQAHEWGMIWQLAEDDQLENDCQQLARHLATQPTYGLGLTKRSLFASGHHSLEQQLKLERDLQRLAGRSEDYREGVSAFFAKRPAHFIGR